MPSIRVIVVTGDRMQHTGTQEDLLKEMKSELHPAWIAFIRYCQRLSHGEIEKLKIQDGLPVLAEIVTEKVKFL